MYVCMYVCVCVFVCDSTGLIHSRPSRSKLTARRSVSNAFIRVIYTMLTDFHAHVHPEPEKKKTCHRVFISWAIVMPFVPVDTGVNTLQFTYLMADDVMTASHHASQNCRLWRCYLKLETSVCNAFDGTVHRPVVVFFCSCWEIFLSILAKNSLHCRRFLVVLSY